MKSQYKLKIFGIRGSQLSNFIGYVESLSGVTITGIKRLDKKHLKKKQGNHYAKPRTFKKSTLEDREKMRRLYTVDKRSVQSIAKETGFSVPTVQRYIKG